MQSRNIFLIDMDETLISSTFTRFDRKEWVKEFEEQWSLDPDSELTSFALGMIWAADHQKPVYINGKANGYITRRLDAIEFLTFLRENGTVVVYSAAGYGWIEAALKHTGLIGLIDYYVSSQELDKRVVVLKDQVDLADNWILVDNMPYDSIPVQNKLSLVSDSFSKQNFIKIEDFELFDDESSEVLMDVLEEIKKRLCI